MYNFNGNYINLLQVNCLVCQKSADPSYPWELIITLNPSGKTLGVMYKTKQARDDEAKRIADQINNCFYRMNPETLSRWDVTSIVSKETDKIRRDVRTLKALVTESVGAK